jgi:hypothetical protein
MQATAAPESIRDAFHTIESLPSNSQSLPESPTTVALHPDTSQTPDDDDTPLPGTPADAILEDEALNINVDGATTNAGLEPQPAGGDGEVSWMAEGTGEDEEPSANENPSRPSRPDSAQVALLIEGYNDDFLALADESLEVTSESALHEPPNSVPPPLCQPTCLERECFVLNPGKDVPL